MQIKIPQSLRKLLEDKADGHVVTFSVGGKPELPMVWMDVDGDELLFNTAEVRLQSDLPRDVVSRLRAISKMAARALGIRDLGRIDFRLGEDGKPSILEVNPNPYLHGDGLIDALKAIGRSHPQMIANMIWCALARAGK